MLSILRYTNPYPLIFILSLLLLLLSKIFTFNVSGAADVVAQEPEETCGNHEASTASKRQVSLSVDVLAFCLISGKIVNIISSGH